MMGHLMQLHYQNPIVLLYGNAWQVVGIHLIFISGRMKFNTAAKCFQKAFIYTNNA